MPRPFPDSKIWPVIDWIGNATTIPERWCYSVFAFQWGYGSYDCLRNFRLQIGQGEKAKHYGADGSLDGSLYYNGMLFFRIGFPFYVGAMLRWAGSDPHSKEYLQFGFGWKMNGRFTITLRVQSDLGAAEGMDGANYGQAIGWADGPK